MRKALILSFLSVLCFTQIYAAPPVRSSMQQEPANNKVVLAFDVRIKLVRTDGTPVNGPHGLRGCWARNVQTGVYYDTTDREGYEFAGLPAGTYTFGAYPGNWDGAVSKTVTLDGSQEGPDGFTEVTLVYWVE